MGTHAQKTPLVCSVILTTVQVVVVFANNHTGEVYYSETKSFDPGNSVVHPEQLLSRAIHAMADCMQNIPIENRRTIAISIHLGFPWVWVDFWKRSRECLGLEILSNSHIEKIISEEYVVAVNERSAEVVRVIGDNTLLQLSIEQITSRGFAVAVGDSIRGYEVSGVRVWVSTVAMQKIRIALLHVGCVGSVDFGCVERTIQAGHCAIRSANELSNDLYTIYLIPGILGCVEYVRNLNETVTVRAIPVSMYLLMSVKGIHSLARYVQQSIREPGGVVHIVLSPYQSGGDSWWKTVVDVLVRQLSEIVPNHTITGELYIHSDQNLVSLPRAHTNPYAPLDCYVTTYTN